MLWSQWGERLNAELLQVKFGSRRVVIANSFDMVRELFVRNANQTSARPRQYIFEHFIGEWKPLQNIEGGDKSSFVC